ncbi:MAG: polymer-forming cytoskeletal protein [Lachnospiraceae bacterium]|nr:polymer-forming cytoskeletal protein [Lachnospiraceae bacterium]
MKKQEIRITTLIGKGAVLDGDFSAPDSARIDGCVNGDVTVEGTLVLGTAAVISGNIQAEAAIIGGEVNGNVTAQRKVEITATARVIGDVNTESIVIDEHAIFQGSCNMNQEVPDHQNRRKAVYRKAARNGKRSAAAAVAAALQEVRDEEEKEGMGTETVDAVSAESLSSEE